MSKSSVKHDQAFRVVQMSDLHVDPARPQDIHRLELVRRAVARLKPRLIVATGDVAEDAFRHPDRLTDMRDELAKFPCPVLVVPGNHDIGNKSSVSLDPVRPEYVKLWRSVFPDTFVHRFQRWRLVGLNSQIIGSGIACEQRQLHWLDEQLADADAGDESVAVFLHMPLFLRSPDENLTGSQSDYWVPDKAGRDALLQRLNHRRVKLVASGHVHWHARFNLAGKIWVWCPSASGLVVSDDPFPPGGDVAGLIQYDFLSDAVTHELVPLPLPLNKVVFQGPLPGA